MTSYPPVDSNNPSFPSGVDSPIPDVTEQADPEWENGANPWPNNVWPTANAGGCDTSVSDLEPNNLEGLGQQMANLLENTQCSYNADANFQARGSAKVGWGGGSANFNSSGSASVSKTGCESINALAKQMQQLQQAVNCNVANIRNESVQSNVSTQTIDISYKGSIQNGPINISQVGTLKTISNVTFTNQSMTDMTSDMSAKLKDMSTQSNDTTSELGSIASSTKNAQAITQAINQLVNNASMYNTSNEIIVRSTINQTVRLSFEDTTINGGMTINQQFMSSTASGAVVSNVISTLFSNSQFAEAISESIQSNVVVDTGFASIVDSYFNGIQGILVAMGVIFAIVAGVILFTGKGAFSAAKASFVKYSFYFMIFFVLISIAVLVSGIVADNTTTIILGAIGVVLFSIITYMMWKKAKKEGMSLTGKKGGGGTTAAAPAATAAPAK